MNLLIPKSKLRRVIDLAFIPLLLITLPVLKLFRKNFGANMPFTKKLLLSKGIFPVLNHYYEPLFNYSLTLKHQLSKERYLPGIDFNLQKQLDYLQLFNYNTELEEFPIENNQKDIFFYHNSAFEAGDAEYYYNIIRTLKPRKVIEVGGGFSTLIGKEAIKRNLLENPSIDCKYICIEPFENKWLEAQEITLIREKVENTDMSLFEGLDENDILFIDTSHIIRPQGDVLFLINRILPILKKGVYVQIHDIFTPFDYPEEWLIGKNYFWNEQYLIEAFLSMNNEFEIIGALNFLKNKYPTSLYRCCPILAKEPKQEPGSLWLLKK